VQATPRWRHTLGTLLDLLHAPSRASFLAKAQLNPKVGALTTTRQQKQPQECAPCVYIWPSSPGALSRTMLPHPFCALRWWCSTPLGSLARGPGPKGSPFEAAPSGGIKGGALGGGRLRPRHDPDGRPLLLLRHLLPGVRPLTGTRGPEAPKAQNGAPRGHLQGSPTTGTGGPEAPKAQTGGTPRPLAGFAHYRYRGA